jgi:hypothetical protein
MSIAVIYICTFLGVTIYPSQEKRALPTYRPHKRGHISEKEGSKTGHINSHNFTYYIEVPFKVSLLIVP